MTKKVTYTDMHGKKGKVEVDKLVFRPSVYGILIEGDKILLSKQWDGYDFPGGGVKIDENIKDALKREFWEETGFEVEVDEVVFCDSVFFKFTNRERCYNSILVYYLVRRIGGEISIDHVDEEEKKYIDLPEWISLKNIDKIKFYNSIDSIKIIQEAMRVEKSKK